jgi:hypothetical protein
MTATSPVGAQQRQGIDLEAPRNAFDALERQVALASLYAPHVRPVDTDDIGKRLLAEPALLAVGPQAPAHRSLKLAFHAVNSRGLLLDSLQTYK